MQEIGRTVKRIDDPLEFGITSRSTLFGQNGMGRIGIEQDFDDGLLGSTINFRNEVILLFALDLDHVQIVGCAIDDRTGATGGFHRSVEHRVHGDSRAGQNGLRQ